MSLSRRIRYSLPRHFHFRTGIFGEDHPVALFYFEVDFLYRFHNGRCRQR